MSIVVVGGNDRMAGRYKEICKAYNCKAKVFTQMPADLSSKIGQPDLMVVFTSTCSHKMVGIVDKKAEKDSVKVVRCHSASVSALKNVLEEHCAG